MIKKKLITQSSKSQKNKTKISIRARREDHLDLYDEYSEDQSDLLMLHDENLIDDFEHLQSLPDKPSTLEEVEDEEFLEEEEQEPTSKSDDDIQSHSLTARGNKNKHYVKPEEFEGLIKEYYKHGELTNDLCDCVYKIANRLSYRPNFVNYTFREEMVGDAIERMVFALSNKIYKYNPNKIGKNGKKGNAFLYFTKIAENAFINRIKIESRNREAISNYQEDVYINLVQKGIDIKGNSNMYTE